MKIAESADELEEIKEAHDAVDSDNVESCTLLEKLPDTDDQAVYEVSTSTDGTEDAAAVNKAGDVGIFKSFKDHMSVIIDQWKRSDQVTYTRGGNPRSPTIKKAVTWVSAAWRQVPDSVVQKSIGKCGSSTIRRTCSSASMSKMSQSLGNAL
ncbi:hypothetical protein PR003_g14104 [Phytophthora rubi]|uniref:DDE-1 domain-containing protein n=1 Tax=Phytophthora rubi TaxID=129364 RepID=A0A6A4F3W0_9STRA|nr:hypothetical protein PR003_g14104 [Phytophthora rubi]